MGIFGGRGDAGRGPNTQAFSADPRASAAGISVGLLWALCTVSKAPVSISGDKTLPVIFQQHAKPSETAHPPQVPASCEGEKDRPPVSISCGKQPSDHAKKKHLMRTCSGKGPFQPKEPFSMCIPLRQYHCALTRGSGVRTWELRN